MAKSFKNKISEWREYILFILAVVQIVGIIAAAYLGSRLAPLSQDIAVLQTEIEANSKIDSDEHAKFVTDETFNQVIERINHISSRVDQIYSLIK